MKKLIYLLAFLISSQISQGQQMTDSILNASLKEAFQYLKPNDKPLNPDKAYVLIKKCADAGNPKAFFALGWMYARGVGVQANKDQAIFWYDKAAKQGIARAWTRIGILYKHGINGQPDFVKAYEYYSKAADVNDAQGLMEKGYMLYKGFGCKQNYEAAYPLFQKSAKAGYAHGMRFLALSMRNGYGTKINTDSAMYWFRMASKYGNGMSNDELAIGEPENADIAGTLIDKIKAAQKLLPDNRPINKYTRIIHSMPANDVEGTYSGWLLKYDWSGQHVVQVDKLNIELVYGNNQITGKWIENDSVSVPLSAILTPDALVFKNMEYNKHDHYYRKYTELLRFEKAGLKIIKNNGDVYLCGDLQMYGVKQDEPSNPRYIALLRSTPNQKESDKNIPLVNEDGSPLILKKLSAYPNPFSTVFTLDFELKESSVVETKLQTLDGKVVYDNAAGRLEAGNYALPIQPQNLSSGTYILTLQYGKSISTIKMIRL